jgi:ABC-type bacteriocin/lantibiotic exporter with double-glycine peptidase domain
MAKTTFAAITIIIAFIAILGYLAITGSIMAIITLTIGITIIVFCAGAGLAIYTVKIMQTKAQQDFQANAQENLDIMQNMQRLQNLQNDTVMKQLSQASRLPDNGQFLIEDGLFDEL